MLLREEWERRLHLFQEDKLDLKTKYSARGWAPHTDSAHYRMEKLSNKQLHPRNPSSMRSSNPWWMEPFWGKSSHLPVPRFLNVKWGIMASSSTLLSLFKVLHHVTSLATWNTQYLINTMRPELVLEPVNMSVNMILITFPKRPRKKDSLGI